MFERIKEFRINDYLEVVLDHVGVKIFVNDRIFCHCSKIPVSLNLENSTLIENLPIYDTLEKSINVEDGNYRQIFESIPIEDFYWAQCSTLQVWVENQYTTNLLSDDISFPLLKRLVDAGDKNANQVFEKEIIKRLKNDYVWTKYFLIESGYLEYLSEDNITGHLAGLWKKTDFENIQKYDLKYRLKILGNLNSKITDNQMKLKYISELRKTIQSGNAGDINTILWGINNGELNSKDIDISELVDILLNIDVKYEKAQQLEDILMILGDLNYGDSKVYKKVIKNVLNEGKYIQDLIEFLIYEQNLGIIDSTDLELVNIKKLSLGERDYSLSTIPKEIGKLKSLEELSLFEEREIETLPEELFNLPLKKIYMTGCESLVIPDSIGNLQSLEELDLSYNDMDGLPGSIKSIRTLKKINLSGNNFNSFPEFISEMVNLEMLSIGSNNIVNIPESITNLKSLKKLDISWNPITPFPEIISNLKSLEIFKMEHVKEEYQIPKIPSSLKNLKNLREFNLSENDLGYFPQWITELTNLEVLDLSRNRISEIPEKISNLINLREFILESNIIKVLPDSISQLHLLERLWLYFNRLNSIPESIGQLKNLTSLALSYNNLTYLPDSIGDLSSLETLYLEKNFLTRIPNSIGKLTLLSSLDLRKNKLKKMPASIKILKNLRTLQLKENYFERLPESSYILSEIYENIDFEDDENSKDKDLFPLKYNVIGDVDINPEDLSKISYKFGHQEGDFVNFTVPIEFLPTEQGLIKMFHPALKMGHRFGAKCLALSCDEKYLFSGSQELKMWETGKFCHVRTLYGEGGRFECLLMYGDLLISGSSDGIIRFWNFNTGELMDILEGPLVGNMRFINLENIIISPNNKYLYSFLYIGRELLDTSKRIELWDIETSKFVKVIEPSIESFYYITLTPDGKNLVGIADWDKIGIIDSFNGQVRNIFDNLTEEPEYDDMEPDTLHHCVMSPDGKFIYVDSNYNHLKKIEFSTGKVLASGECYANLLIVSPDGKYLTNGRELFSADTLEKIREFKQPKPKRNDKDPTMEDAIFTKDVGFLITTSDTIRIFEVESGDLIYTIEEIKYGTKSIIVQGGDVCSLVNDKFFRWNLKDGITFSKGKTIGKTNDGFYAPFKGNHVITTVFEDKYAGDFVNGGIHIWDNNTFEHQKHLRNFWFGGVDRNGKKIGLKESKLPGNSTFILTLPELEQIKQLVIHSECGQYLAFSPTEQYFVNSSSDNKIRLYNFKAGNLMMEIDTPKKIQNLLFSPDGKYLVGSTDELHSENSFSIWDVHTGVLLFKKTSNPAKSFGFSDDSNLLAIGSSKGLLIMNLVKNFYYEIVGHPNNIIQIVFINNNSQIATSDDYGNVYIWDYSHCSKKEFEGFHLPLPSKISDVNVKQNLVQNGINGEEKMVDYYNLEDLRIEFEKRRVYGDSRDFDLFDVEVDENGDNCVVPNMSAYNFPDLIDDPENKRSLSIDSVKKAFREFIRHTVSHAPEMTLLDRIEVNKHTFNDVKNSMLVSLQSYQKMIEGRKIKYFGNQDIYKTDPLLSELLKVTEEKSIIIKKMGDGKITKTKAIKKAKPLQKKITEIESQVIREHIVKNLGEIQNTLYDNEHPDIPIKLYIIPPNKRRKYKVLITSGMSAYPMMAPSSAEPIFTELFMLLSPEWPLSLKSREKVDFYWPIKYLFRLAKYIHFQKQWFSIGHTFGNNDPPQFFAKNTKLCAFLFQFPLMELPPTFCELKIGYKPVYFLQLIPIYKEEMEYIIQYGPSEFNKQILRQNIPEYLDLRRENLSKDMGEMPKANSMFCRNCGTIVRNIDPELNEIECNQCGKMIDVNFRQKLVQNGKNDEEKMVIKEDTANLLDKFKGLVYKFLQENEGAYTVRAIHTRLNDLIINPDEKRYIEHNLQKILEKMRSIGTINSTLHKGEDHFFIP
ncbi:hypothetical protein LCGC14_0652700 [marine sediment metagenome]|uniref:Leucine-rich repeat and WD repeat-containing protein 1 n=1 Tax=marine sediment metagenome TaxID=412755 RepID=A0A0F9U494_9ZZZZ|nr:hypothetical protein [bacterium]